MPLLEALDNKGKRTGRTKLFTTSEYNRLMRLKKPMWVLLQNDVPKHRTPMETPTDKDKLLEYITTETNVEELKKILNSDGRKSIKLAVEKRIDEVTNKPE